MAPLALRTIVLREFGEAGLASWDQFNACLLLLAEERLGTKRRLPGYAEDEQMRNLKGTYT